MISFSICRFSIGTLTKIAGLRKKLVSHGYQRRRSWRAWTRTPCMHFAQQRPTTVAMAPEPLQFTSRMVSFCRLLCVRMCKGSYSKIKYASHTAAASKLININLCVISMCLPQIFMFYTHSAGAYNDVAIQFTYMELRKHNSLLNELTGE